MIKFLPLHYTENSYIALFNNLTMFTTKLILPVGTIIHINNYIMCSGFVIINNNNNNNVFRLSKGYSSLSLQSSNQRGKMCSYLCFWLSYSLNQFVCNNLVTAWCYFIPTHFSVLDGPTRSSWGLFFKSQSLPHTSLRDCNFFFIKKNKIK